MQGTVTKLDYRCRGQDCEVRNDCRRFIVGKSNVPYAAFDSRNVVFRKTNTPRGIDISFICDGKLPRIMEPIRVESEGGLA